MRNSMCAVLAFGVLFFGSLASAQTPDGENPATEDVCDGETGAAFGLCTAYCEAMDCDSDDPSASPKACSKVARNFERITGRVLPCEAVACPCFTAQDLQDGGEILACGENFPPPLSNLAGIFYADNLAACSGFNCAGADPTIRACALNTASAFTEALDISLEEDSACRALVLQNCPSPNRALTRSQRPQSSTPFIDQ
jgi:hypothetical protein